MTKENQNIEWKESWRDEYIKWICGFANAQGGALYIGINDKGFISGVDDAERLLEEIPNKIRDILGIMVNVNLLSQNDLSFLEILVEPYPYPINYKGQYHFRSGSTKQELKGLALNKFLLEKTGKRWDAMPQPFVKVADLETRAFDYFRKQAARSKRVDTSVLNETNEALLIHLNLLENDLLKRAGFLLFHPMPDRYITGAYVKIGFFASQSDILYQDEVHGTLFEQVNKTMDLLLTKYMSAYISYQGIHRVETYPYPEAALRDAVLNAIAHKDYSSGSPIQIKVYRDGGLFIWNDGEMPNNWTIETLSITHGSKPRNPDISNTFFRAGMVESWGRGISKILEECAKAEVPKPFFELTMGGVDVRFSPKIMQGGTVKMSGKMSVKMSGKIIEMITENAKITIPEIATVLEVTERTVERAINKLKTENKIERIGAKKGGYWEIKAKV
jgi:ATP-dependent DNA helicase RecG